MLYEPYANWVAETNEACPMERTSVKTKRETYIYGGTVDLKIVV